MCTWVLTPAYVKKVRTYVTNFVAANSHGSKLWFFEVLITQPTHYAAPAIICFRHQIVLAKRSKWPKNGSL